MTPNTPKRPPGRPPGTTKYGEPKKRHNVVLTDEAWKWYQAQGGNDWLEQQARQRQ